MSLSTSSERRAVNANQHAARIDCCENLLRVVGVVELGSAAAGFSLVTKFLIAFVIGMIGMVVMLQVFANFEDRSGPVPVVVIPSAAVQFPIRSSVTSSRAAGESMRFR